ncbi:hypothetical protein N0V93_007797 [Gnomoniopsis smithogilvyi]|uniref:FAD-binding FR-type domain-containing protein n=1 Tax=Gnomoniopsis smithogilvyi TaxID=1191159 RepID=A0A9W8YLT0_9PEZI|nr:hypothetical protein N0V93_007797 [Gnomoniopsis smithogilvyi]
MHTDVLFSVLIWLSFSLLPVRCADPYPEPDELCLASCSLSLSKQTFAGKDASDATAQACENDLYLQSLYLCARNFCTEGDIEPGRAFESLLCEDEGLPRLPSASIAANLSIQDAQIINSTFKGKKLNHTVIPDNAFFELSYASTQSRAQGRYTNRDYQSAIWIFWGIVIGLATLVHTASTVLAGAWPPNSLTGAVRTIQAYAGIPRLLPGQSHPSPSRLESIIIVAFVLLSLVLCGVQIQAFPQSSLYASFPLQVWGLVGRRLSSLALANIPVIWIFSMRNSPLIWLTGWSFATFNQFHRWIARLTVFELIAHAIAFTEFEFIKGGAPRYESMFEELWWQMGIVAMICLSCMLVLSMPIIRYKFYDIFLLLHIALAVVSFVGVWYHLEQWHSYFNGYLYPVIAVWVLERLMRLIRVLVVLCFGSGGAGHAALSWDEAANIVRIDATDLIRKLHPQPGSTYYLYTPTRFPFYPSHPFTLAVFPNDTTGYQQTETNNGSQEKNGSLSATVSKQSGTGNTRSDLQYRFLIRPGDGFTRRLQRYAAANSTIDKNNSVRLPILVEGPYTSGNLAPERSGCKSILVLAGGSGISVAISVIHRALATTKSNVMEVRLNWAVKRRATVESVVNEELRVFSLDPRFSIQCFITDPSYQAGHSENESESGLVSSTARPNVSHIIENAVASSTDKLAVVVCGPQSMTEDARNVVSNMLKGGNRDVKLFVENFGW